MNREITSGELIGANCKYWYVDTIIDQTEPDREITKKGWETMDTPIHDDLRLAFRAIIPHFILLCDQHKETKEIKLGIQEGLGQFSELESVFYPYDVTKFTIKGNGRNEGVIFNGSRILPNGGILLLTSPKINWDDEDYKHISELIEAVENLKEETYQYTQGKKQPPPPTTQEALNFDAIDMEVIEPSEETGI